MLEFADERAAFDAFQDRYSDGLPVVLPTEDRVREMLARADRAPDDVLGAVYPSGNMLRVHDAAVNAIMAGARPAQFRIILTAIDALLDERFNLNGLQSTTHCGTPMTIVSGPLAAASGLDAGNNVLGNGLRGNIAVGRTLRLLMTNVGGGRPGETDMSVQGTPAKLAFCVPERLDAVDWPPLAERLGGAPGSTSVTLFAADAPIHLSDHRSATPQRLLRNLADPMRHVATMSALRPGTMVLLLCPQHARICTDAGWSVEDVQRYLFAHARNPVWRLRDAGEWDPEKSLSVVARYGDPEDPETTVPAFASPESLLVVVTGGASGGFSTAVPAWPASEPVTRFISG